MDKGRVRVAPMPLLRGGSPSTLYLWMRLVRGSISFLPSLGSKGVRAPNCGNKGTVVTGMPIEHGWKPSTHPILQHLPA